VKDHTLSSVVTATRTMESHLGPFQLLTVTVGTSSSTVGHYYGRLTGSLETAGLYVYFRVRLLGFSLFSGCWSLG
jgi:hypothetical protein